MSELEEIKKQKQDEIKNLSKDVEDLRRIKDSISAELTSTEAKNIISRIVSKSELDHVVLAAKDLPGLEETFEKLGFHIKKGHRHANGIVNSFIKFKSGKAIELLTVENPGDETTGIYNEFLGKNEGGVFYALKTDSIEVLEKNLNILGYKTELENNKSFSTLIFEKSNLTDNFFFIEYRNNIEDPVGLTEHINLSFNLISVWVYCDTPAVMENWLSKFGIDPAGSIFNPVLNIKGKSFIINRSNIRIFEGGNGIFGLTIECMDIFKTQSYFEKIFGRQIKVYSDEEGKSIYIKPDERLRIWIQFVQRGE